MLPFESKIAKLGQTMLRTATNTYNILYFIFYALLLCLFVIFWAYLYKFNHLKRPIPFPAILPLLLFFMFQRAVPYDSHACVGRQVADMNFE